MADNEAQVLSIGTRIIVDTEDALTGLSSPTIAYRKPSGATGSWSASLYSAGKISYVTQAGDLDEVGDWCLQASVTVTDWQGKGKKTILTVLSNCTD